MEKGSFAGRLSLFAFGCASTQGALQPQSQPQPLSRSLPQVSLVSAMSRQELVLLGILIFLIAGLIIIAFENVQKKGKKKAKRSPRRSS